MASFLAVMIDNAVTSVVVFSAVMLVKEEVARHMCKMHLI